MKPIVLLGVMVVVSIAHADGELNFNADPTADKTITFGADEAGRLTVKLENYTGMDEAAKDFFEYLKQIRFCDLCEQAASFPEHQLNPTPRVRPGSP